MADSSITISGALGQEPELRFSGKGTAIAGFSVAVNHRYMQDGEWTDGEVTWWRVSCFNQLAENFAASFHKGDRVIVTGRPQARTWTDQDGNDRTSIEVMADDIGGSVKFARGEFERQTRENRKGEQRTSNTSGRSKTPPAPAYDDKEPF